MDEYFVVYLCVYFKTILLNVKNKEYQIKFNTTLNNTKNVQLKFPYYKVCFLHLPASTPAM